MSQVKISGNASGTGVLTIAAPNTNTDRTINIPDTAGDIVTTGDSGTISASMLDGGQSGSAPAFVVRAWVQFQGTGTVAIRGSGNVSSISDVNTGLYQINYTTALPNDDYSITFGARKDTTGKDSNGRLSSVITTTATRIVTYNESGVDIDSETVCATVVN